MSSLPTSGDPRQHWIWLLEEASQGRLEGLERLLSSGAEAHAPLLRLLTQLDFEESEARNHWNGILRHRAELTSRLGREASVQLAALDYFQTLAPSIKNPKVVEMATFLATERSAITDGLTGLYNRPFFDASLRRELKRARRYGLAFSLVMLDLDDFKMVNDVHGHVVGDEALSRLSEVIRASVREIDVACRYGGEEFALILPETSRTGAYIVSERIRVDAKDLFERKPLGSDPSEKVSMSVSGGIAIYPTDSNSAEGLLRMADKALYRSKHEGKNRITLHAEEKRRSPRLDAKNLLVFRERRARRDRRPDELRSETKNLSRNGALLESQIPLNVGTELEIDIYLPRKRSDFFLKGKVVRLEEAPEQSGDRARYHVGVAFLADDEEDAQRLETLASEIYGPLESHGGESSDHDRIG
ncbi:MAG TPA: diguanylate cyclase [Vicinamibacteria bacterium]